MALDGSFWLVAFALALVDYLLEQERACCKYGENGPDLQGRLGLRGRDVGWRFVRACGLAWLAEAGCVGTGGAEGTSDKGLRSAEEDTWAEE